MSDPFCWHVLPTDPPGTKPYITWGGELECPVCHPELYEPYGKPVVVDRNSGEPCTPEGDWIPKIIHCGQWIKRKVVPMDPIKQLSEPIAEVRRHASRFVDEYGESWVVIDGIETKCPSLKQAQALLNMQDGVRKKIREDLDALGIRDRAVEEQLVIGGVPQVDSDGEPIMVGLLPPGDGANTLQIGQFPDAEGLFRNAASAQARADREAADEAARVRHAALAARPPLTKVLDGIKSFFRKDKS